MTSGSFVSFSIFRISYQTGKDNDAAGWEISGFGGSRNVENSQVYRHLHRLPFSANLLSALKTGALFPRFSGFFGFLYSFYCIDYYD